MSVTANEFLFRSSNLAKYHTIKYFIAFLITMADWIDESARFRKSQTKIFFILILSINQFLSKKKLFWQNATIEMKSRFVIEIWSSFKSKSLWIDLKRLVHPFNFVRKSNSFVADFRVVLLLCLNIFNVLNIVSGSFCDGAFSITRNTK